MASSKKWATTISSIASFIYFLLILLQIPLFRVPCRAGICTTPLELTSSQLIATKLIPEAAVKTLLYPGAVANAFFNNNALPNYYNFLKSYRFALLNSAPVTFDDLQQIEVLAGSYLSVAGAFVCLVKPGRISLFGTLLIIWGLAREVIMGNSVDSNPGKAVYISPAMAFVLVFAFLCVRKDVRKIFRSCRGRPALKAKLG